MKKLSDVQRSKQLLDDVDRRRDRMLVRSLKTWLDRFDGNDGVRLEMNYTAGTCRLVIVEPNGTIADSTTFSEPDVEVHSS